MISLLIHKSSRTLVAQDGERAALRCRVALGHAPEGHKLREGDGRTPEGEYAVCSRNPESKFHKSLGLSYPNDADAQAALKDGRISADEYARILAAHATHRRPPWDGPLGGFIMIHGGGAEGDWTQGCIAVSDRDMDTLWDLCPLGTKVLIVP